MRTPARRFGAALALAAVSACHDDVGREAHFEDAVDGPPGMAYSRACQDCVMDGHVESRAAYDACVANVKCNRMAVCEFERGCLTTAIRDPRCLRICTQQAGIRTLTDPAFQLASRLNVSASAHCTDACGAR